MIDKNFEMMDTLVSFITQMDEWSHIQRHDPQIRAALKQVDAVMEKIRASVTDDIMNELEDALIDYGAAHDDAAVLYGIRVAIALNDAIHRPLELSQYIVDRTAFRKTGVWNG